MNKLRRYITPLTSSVLVLLAMLMPVAAFAASNDASFIQKLVWTVLVAITGSILYISGIVFDFSVNSFVIGFADYYANSGVGFAVDRTWVTIRDFVNLFFIFGLIYIGFKMILDSDDSNTRRWLVNLIIAALLINFSLFITKFVVDFSNQISTQIAVSGFCDNGTCPQGKSATGIPNSVDNVNITDKILKLMGIASLFNLSQDESLNHASWGYIFGTAIMMLVASFVLIAGGFLLTIRFALLNLFMVLSPFMFIGWILPPLSNMTSKYWDAFLKRAFFAPVYFLFLYFSLEIMKAFQQSLASTNGLQNTANVWASADAANQLQTTQSTMPFFILVCIFLLASIVISQKIGADGASTAIKYGQMARQKLQRGVTRGVGAGTAGVAGRIGRNTIGRAAYRAVESDKFKDYASRSVVGKYAYKATQKGASATFDARNIGGAGKALGLGEASKGGFQKRVEDAKKEADKFVGKDGLGFTDIDKPENKARVDAEKKRIQDEATADKKITEGSKKEFEENLNGSISGFIASIDSLTQEIEKSEQELADGDKNGTLTDADKQKRQADIDRDKEQLAQKSKALSALKRTQEKYSARQDALKNMQSVNADPSADEATKTQARDAFEKAEAAYTKQIADERAQMDNSITEADKKFKEAENEAKAAIKYERQRAYMQQQKDSAKLWRSVATLGISSGAGGLLGAATIGGAGAFGAGAIGGLSAAGSKSYVADQVASELDDKYGKGGVKAIGKEKKKKAVEEFAAAFKSSDEAKDGGEKKEDGDKKEGE